MRGGPGCGQTFAVVALTMKLRKPPIVEAWIEFHFQGCASQQTWPDKLNEWLESIADQFPKREVRQEEAFKVIERTPAGIPATLAGVGGPKVARAFDSKRTRCVQVAKDVLVFNLIKREEEYPGFQELLPCAMVQLADYRKVFEPETARAVALHYTDRVSIPAPEDNPLLLDDYFAVGLRVPCDEDWPLRDFGFHLAFSLHSDDVLTDSAQLSFRPEKSGESAHRFRLDWHVNCGEVDTLDSDDLSERLRRAHDALNSRFRSCFTEKCWALFEEDSQET